MRSIVSISAAVAPFMNALFRMRQPAAQNEWSADEFRRLLNRQLATTINRCREMNLTEDDCSKISEALCALADETVAHASTTWMGRDDWMREKMMMEHHQDGSIGRKFYENLEGLRPDQVAVLEVYALCMASGFGGKYRESPDQLMQVLNDTINRVPGLRDRISIEPTPGRVPPESKGADIPPAVPSLVLIGAIAVGVLSVVAAVSYYVTVGSQLSWVGN